jgi:hypothetical protein
MSTESLVTARKLLTNAVARRQVVGVRYFDRGLLCAVSGRPARVEPHGVRFALDGDDRHASAFVGFDRIYRIDDAEGSPLLVVEGFTADGEVRS